METKVVFCRFFLLTSKFCGENSGSFGPLCDLFRSSSIEFEFLVKFEGSSEAQYLKFKNLSESLKLKWIPEVEPILQTIIVDLMAKSCKSEFPIKSQTDLQFFQIWTYTRFRYQVDVLCSFIAPMMILYQTTSNRPLPCTGWTRNEKILPKCTQNFLRIINV